MASTTDRAAVIRAALKAKGWSSRDVSVRSDYFSMGSSIRVSIKNADVPLATVKGIAEAHESIARDHFGDILSGGNRYVHVSYAHQAAETLTDRRLAQVEQAADALKTAGENTLEPVPGTEYLLGRGRHGYGFAIWKMNGGHQVEVQDTRGAALYVAIGSWNQ